MGRVGIISFWVWLSGLFGCVAFVGVVCFVLGLCLFFFVVLVVIGFVGLLFGVSL